MFVASTCPVHASICGSRALLLMRKCLFSAASQIKALRADVQMLHAENHRLHSENERLCKENANLRFDTSALENDYVLPPTYESVAANSTQSTASGHLVVHDETPEGANAGHEANDVDSANDALSAQLQALTSATSAKLR